MVGEPREAGQSNELNQILSTLTVDGTAHITEQDVLQTGSQVGVSLLTNLPLAFTNTEPAGSFVGISNGNLLTFTPATSSSLATITRNAGSWTTDGFQAGDSIDVAGSLTANDGTYVIASISTNGEVLTLAAGSVLVNESSAPDVTVTNPQTPDGSFQGTASGPSLTFTPSASAATIALSSGSWTADGFLPGERISVTGTGTANDGTYVIAPMGINGSTLTLAAGSTLVSQSDATDVSVIAYVATPGLAPIVEPIDSSNPSVLLEVWTVVLDSSGNIIHDMVQEWGSQEFGIQETNGSGQALYYDQEGNPTTNAVLTGIPIIDQVAAGTANAMPVYFSASNDEVFTNTGNPVFILNFTSGSPLYVGSSGYLTTTVTNVPFLIPVDRTEVIPWTVASVTEATEQGTNSLTLDDSGDTNNVTGTVSTTQIPINQLKNGQPVYDGGAMSPTAEYYFGGEPVIDPFTGNTLTYSGGQPVLNLLTGQPEYGPNGEPLLHKAGDPVLHQAGDPVVHTDGDTQLYLGGELVNQGLVADSALLTGNPSLTFAPAADGNDATITRTAGNWLTDGFTVGSEMLVSGTQGGADDGLYTIAAVRNAGSVLSVVPYAGSVTAISAATGVSVVGLEPGGFVSDSAAMTGSPSVSFAAASGAIDATITRSAGNWLMDGFTVGSALQVTGIADGEDDGVYTIAAIDATGTILSVVPASGSVTAASGVSGATALGLLTYGGGETAIHDPLDPVLDLIDSVGQPVPVGKSYTPPAFYPSSGTFPTSLDLSSLSGFNYQLKAGDVVNLIVYQGDVVNQVVYQGTSIYQLPAADFTVDTAANTITISSGVNLTGVTEIAVSIATQAYHAAGDPMEYYGFEPLQVGQPVVMAGQPGVLRDRPGRAVHGRHNRQ